MNERKKTERKNRRLQEVSEKFDRDHALVIVLQDDHDRDLENMKGEFPLKIEIILIVILDLLVINILAAVEVIDHDLDQMIVTTAADQDDPDLDPDLVIEAEEEVTSPASVPQETAMDTENVIVNEIAIVIQDHTKDVRDHDHGRIHSEDLVKKLIKQNYWP